jgi:predicted RNA-binding Zn ribbon-like protein
MHDTDRPAPGDLRLVQRLVNTLDIEEQTDELSDTWLESAGLGGGDLDAVREFREAVRSVLLSHNGVPADRAALDRLGALARTAPVVVGFGPEPVLEGADALGRLFAIVAAASVAGTWERLKACPADDCHWAFYDFSRNHSRTWCDMRVCGNRAKARTFRSRRP